jgi:peptidylprolyl isomerase
MAVIATAATMLTDSALQTESGIEALGKRLGELKIPDDIEPMVAIVQALGMSKSEKAIPFLLNALNAQEPAVSLEAATSLEKITGESYRDRVIPNSVPSHTDYDWDFLEKISEHPLVSVETTRGEFRFMMQPDEAPFTCLNIARLMLRGFYDGLIFHRVVPNFVIQGGDPRGDGWGGPGYTMRSEFGRARYERGMVGVASAGKDTEGCQFFVTHSRQPHLDGRYTIFGRVVSGMEVVDRIQIGDRIVRMKLVQ